SPGEGNRPRPLYRAHHCPRARRPGLRAERGRGTRRHVHRGASARNVLASRSPRGAGGMSRVLVVGDEQHIAEGVRFNLEADGHEVVIADTGEQALTLLLGNRSPFDVVVLDVMLPGKDGFAVASELRAIGQYVPILMLTARDRPEDVLRGFES